MNGLNYKFTKQHMESKKICWQFKKINIPQKKKKKKKKEKKKEEDNLTH